MLKNNRIENTKTIGLKIKNMSGCNCKSEIMLGNPDGNFQNRQLAQMSPSLVLEGETPRLIDEWQEVPQLWDAVRYKVDQNGNKG